MMSLLRQTPQTTVRVRFYHLNFSELKILYSIEDR